VSSVAFSRYWRVGAAAGLIGWIALVVIEETLLRPDHEVLYSAALVVANCPEIEGRKRCAALYRISIANSGRARQEEVRVEWGPARDLWTFSTNVTDLVGSAAKRSDPRITETPGEGRRIFHIRDFEPNTLVELKFDCMLCPPEEIRSLRNAQARVDAKGEVVNADPRGTVFRRAMRNLARTFGLFR